MHHKANPQPCSTDDLSEQAVADAHVQHAVFGTVLDLLPCFLTVPEMVREVGPKERDEVERAVEDLVGAGLLRCEGESVMPTRAAMLATRLADLS